MKKKAFLVLLASALLVTGCGKDEEKKDEKKDEKNSSVSVLKCTAEEDNQKMTMTIEQDKKSYEIKKVEMEMSAPKSLYEEYGFSDEDLEKMICEEEDDVESCDAKVTSDTVSATIKFKTDKYVEELKEEENIEKLDADTLKKLKESGEKDGYSCTIS